MEGEGGSAFSDDGVEVLLEEEEEEEEELGPLVLHLREAEPIGRC